MVIEDFLGKDLIQTIHDAFENQIKSDYQKNLESKGWEHITNEDSYNYHIGWDMPPVPIKESLKRMRDYYRLVHPGSQVRIFRAYDFSGRRSSLKTPTIVAVYIRPKTNISHLPL